MDDIKLKTATKNHLISALVFSVLIPVGIPGIIFGAINHLWVLMSFGILFALCGFYGTPLLWVAFADDKRIARILVQIRGGMLSVDRLALFFKTPKVAMKATLRKMIDRRYLLGYSFSNDKFLIEHKPRTSYEKCPECGAGVNVIGWSSECPYCKALVMNEHPYKNHPINISIDQYTKLINNSQKILVLAFLPQFNEIEVSDSVTLECKGFDKKIKAYVEEVIAASEVSKLLSQKPKIDFGFVKESKSKICKFFANCGEANQIDIAKYGVIGLCLSLEHSNKS